MTRLSDHPRLDEAFRNATLWREEADALRKVLLKCGLTEELKWGKPCYTWGGCNICIIQRMKGFLALLFFKGALLKDPDGVLEVQGPNSRAGYRIRFTSVQDVAKKRSSIEGCVRQAIEVERSGLEVGSADEPDLPAELLATFGKDPQFQEAFERLTPGRRRGYILHFAGAKQSATRQARIDRYRDRVVAGKGLHDR